MESDFDLTIWLAIWVTIIALVIRSQWQLKLPSVGLPFSYLLALPVIHWFGGLIYTLPWYFNPDYHFVELGFVQSVYRVIAFCIGSTLLAPILIRIFKFTWLQGKLQQPSLKLPDTYILCLGRRTYFSYN